MSAEEKVFSYKKERGMDFAVTSADILKNDRK